MTAPPDSAAERPARNGTGTLRAVLRRPLAVSSLAYLAVVTVASIAAPVLAPYEPTATDLGRVLSGPSAEHLLGADSLGRDVLSRLMYGGRVTLTGVAEAMLTVLASGCPPA
jgi:peptide/nickel transport system permease protein